MSAKINFGAIRGLPVMNFGVQDRACVYSAKYKRLLKANDFCALPGLDPDITPHQAFTRWKIARKAWRTRKHGRQLPLPL